jgi:hypothetical protein
MSVNLAKATINDLSQQEYEMLSILWPEAYTAITQVLVTSHPVSSMNDVPLIQLVQEQPADESIRL